MHITTQLAKEVLTKYPNKYVENYADYITDEYPYASSEFAADIFAEVVKIYFKDEQSFRVQRYGVALKPIIYRKTKEEL